MYNFSAKIDGIQLSAGTCIEVYDNPGSQNNTTVSEFFIKKIFGVLHWG